MYVDFLEDPKVLSLAFEDQRHFIGVLALKCSGVIDQECDGKMMDRIVAQKLWIDHSAIVEVKRRLIEVRLIDTLWQPMAWEKRQFVSDHDPTNAERQQRYKQRKQRKQNPLPNGPGNASGNASGNAEVTTADTDTDTDTDTETETEKERECDAASAAPPTPKKLNVFRNTRLSPDWAIPDDWKNWAEQERPDLDIAAEGLCFRDYWLGKGTTHADWQATWRNWVRRADPARHHRPRPADSGASISGMAAI
jgi:hypothetical protein